MITSLFRIKSKTLPIACLSLWLFLSASAQPGGFRFVQLTDLHLSPHNPAPKEDLLRSVEQINASEDIDFVLVTGDLTEEGDRASLESVKEVLDLLKTPYYVVLGNHETKWSDSGCTAYGDIFGEERFRFEHGGILFLGFNSGPLMRMAYGHVAPQDIRWMVEEMEKVGKEKPVILVTHYPMKDGDVDNACAVTDAVRRYNVRAFIGGHYHADRMMRYDGIPGILSRSNLRDKDGKPGYALFEVTADSIRICSRRIGEAKKQWGALSLKDRPYSPDAKADKYPDFSVNRNYPEVTERWVISTGTGIYCSPAVEKNSIFVADDAGVLTCRSLNTGKKRWAFRAGKRIVGTPAVAEGVVVFGSADRHIYGLNAKTGTLLWKIEAAQPVLGAVAIEGRTAYVGASDGTFRAVDLHTGRQRWVYEGVKGYVETKPLLTAGGLVVFGAWDNTLYALDKNSGVEVWKWTGGLTRMHFSPAAVWPVAAGETVFIVDPQRAMTAISAKNGKTLWRTFRSAVRESVGLSADGERVYAKTMNDSVVCYAARGEEPVQLWATDVAFGYEHAPSMLPEKDGVVFGSTNDGIVFALEGTTGRLLWKHKVGNGLVNTVVPLGRHAVLFTDTDGRVGVLTYGKGKSTG